MTIDELPPALPVEESPRFGADHPMRKVTRQVAFEDGWDPTRATKVTELFNGMAANWTADHDQEGRYAALDDALDRGMSKLQADAPPTVVELGSGTGLGTRTLHRRFEKVVAMDLALGMLMEAPAEWAPRVQADASALPLPDDAADILVLVNMLLFPREVDRVLAPAGQLVWINTSGNQTPIHLSAADVADALPGDWHGVASQAGRGTWAVVRR